MSKLLLHGCCQINNFGDVLLMDLLARHVAGRWDGEVVIPWLVEAAHGQVPATAGRGWRDLFGGRAAVLGGGGYLNDGDGAPGSVRRLLRYSGPARLWRAMGVPYAVVGVGAGPIGSKTGAARIAAVCRGAKRLCVRDTATADLLVKAGVPSGAMEVTADLVLSLTPADVPAEATAAAEALLGPKPEGKRRLAVHTSKAGGDGKQIQRLAEAVGEVVAGDERVEVCWIFDHGNRHLDEVRAAAGKHLPGAKVIPHQPHWPTVALIGAMDGVLTTKLHVGITAWAMGVPACGFSAHIKSKRFYEQVGRQRFQADYSDDPAPIRRWLGEFVDSPQTFAEEDASARETLPRAARRNLEVVDEFLDEYAR
ncbi:MAG: polysaccharide pyruvyl transferase family protein [Planctomycetota bacterium]